MTFEKILFVIVEDQICASTAEESMSLAHKLNSDFEVLFVLPDFPRKAEKLVQAYRENIQGKFMSVLDQLDVDRDVMSQSIHFISGKPYAKNILEFAEKGGFDLIIKLPDTLQDNHKKGYNALDVTLIRRSTIPILFINEELRANNAKIYAAIDPFTQSKASEALNYRLLNTADAMATSYEAELHVISCWHFEHETFMRESTFSKIPENEMDQLIEDERLSHETALKDLMQSASLSNDYNLLIHKGRAQEIIPDFMSEHNQDILIMGTVGRTGLKGFFLGNTAENIFKQIDCSLLTIRPE